MAFREKINNKETVIGFFSKTSDAGIIEAFGYAGFDFVIIDLEHGPNNIHNAQDLIRAAQLSGTFPIVRVDKNDAVSIGRALDIGAGGIQIPQISDVGDTMNAVKSSKFQPLGMRGVCRFVRAAEYSSKDRFQYFKEANDSFLVLQLEGKEAIRNIDEIIEVPGIDVIFIGPYDLSQALGVSGQINHPIVLEEIDKIILKCQEKNIATGVFADNIKDASLWIEIGVQYIAYSVDVGIVQDASRYILNQLEIATNRKIRKELN